MLETINNQCKDFLHKIKVPVFRGMNITLRDGVLGKFNKTELSVSKLGDNYKNFSIALDNWFLRSFGYKFRTQGVYCSPSYEQAKSYSKGDAFMIFPIGNISYCYSNDVFAMVHIPELLKLKYADKEELDGVAKNIDQYMKNLNYTSTVPPSNSTKSEIMIGCNSYFAVNANSPHGKFLYDSIYLEHLL